MKNVMTLAAIVLLLFTAIPVHAEPLQIEILNEAEIMSSFNAKVVELYAGSTAIPQSVGVEPGGDMLSIEVQGSPILEGGGAKISLKAGIEEIAVYYVKFGEGVLIQQEEAPNGCEIDAQVLGDRTVRFTLKSCEK